MVKLFVFLCKHMGALLVGATIASMLAGALNAVTLFYLTEYTFKTGWTPTDIPILGSLAVGLLVTRAVAPHLMVVLSARVTERLRSGMARMFTQLRLETVENLGTSSFQGLMFNDLGAINRATSTIPTVLISLVTVIATLGYMTTISLPATAAVLVAIAIVTAVNRMTSTYSKRYLRELQAAHDRLHGGLRGLVDGIKELQLNSERRDLYLTRSVSAHETKSANMFLLDSTLWGLAESFTDVAWMATLAFISWKHATAPSTIETAALGMLFFYLWHPITNLLSFFPTLAHLSVVVQRINDLGFELNQLWESAPSETHPHPPKHTLQSLEAKDLTYVYHAGDEEFRVGPLSLTLHPGEVVFLVGGNGSGKTTMAKLLTGLYRPHEGSLRWNGRIVSPEELREYRQNFSAVFFDFHLFGRVMNNANPQKEDIANDLIRQFGLGAKVSIKDGVLSTTNLSQGQRRRLALIAALLDDRPICVFDEWAADQAPEYRKLYYTDILPGLKRQGKAVLAITHDEQYFHLADRFVKLSAGQIVHESGT